MPGRRFFVLLLCVSTTSGCARRYVTHWAPGCPPQRAQTRFAEDAATSGEIRGTVLDRDTGRPIRGAHISVKSASQSVGSDSSGAFSIAGLPPGHYLISARYIGYEPRTDMVTIRAMRSVKSSIALTPADFDRCMEMVQVKTPLPWWRFW
jgi:hypothetical protein